MAKLPQKDGILDPCSIDNIAFVSGIPGTTCGRYNGFAGMAICARRIWGLFGKHLVTGHFCRCSCRFSGKIYYTPFHVVDGDQRRLYSRCHRDHDA